MVAATLGAASWLLNACKWGADPMATAVPRTGRIAGEIVDLLGAPQPLLGRIFLMYESGLQTGQSVSVDGDGRFAFADIPEGEWQLRFHAPGVAYVPEQLPHPVRVTIMANETTTVRIAIERGWEDGVPMVEIYIGDYFFQEQPFGSANGETVVTLGTPVCWYNVGLTRHTATGGFWDSGALDRTGDGRFSLRVADDGPGAADETLARLNANRRFRGDEGKSGRPGELGLGLAVVREVSDRFGIRWAFRKNAKGWFEAELTGTQEAL